MATTTEIAGLTGLVENLGLSPIPEFPDSHLLEKPLDIGRAYLADILCSLVGCEDALAYRSILWPNNISNGDFSVPLPKLCHERKPKDLASEIATNYRKVRNSSVFIVPIPDGVHLRFMFVLKFLPRILLPYIKDRGAGYGTHPVLGEAEGAEGTKRKKKKVVVEFSSPNIGSEFQGKHLRSTIIGSFIASVHEAMGWDVVRLNYLGDWGKNVALLMVGWENYGSEEAFKEDPVGHILAVWRKIDALFQPEFQESKKVRDAGGDPATVESHGLFAERNAVFKKMEEGDEQTLALWGRLRDASIDNYKSLYARLGVEFDEYSGESYFRDATMARVEKMLAEKGLSEESEGSTIVDMEKLTGRRGGGKVVIRDRNDSQTYALRELANILDRAEDHQFDKMIYVVAEDHDTHFPRIFKLLELMGMDDLAAKLEYKHFSRASKMADKVGNEELTLRGILGHCTEEMQRALEQRPEKAAVLGTETAAVSQAAISGLLVQELVAKRAAPHAFDGSKMTAFDKSSGPELQYWYKRLGQVLAASPPPADPREMTDAHLAAVEEEGEPETNLLRLLAEYPEITASAYQNLESAGLMSYLAELLEQIEACFDVDEEEGEEWQPDALTMGQLAVYDATRQVLENAMRILGITPVDS